MSEKVRRRNCRENVGLLQNGTGNLVPKDIEKAKTFFTSVFTVNTDLQEFQAHETRDKV